jgi:hypothetical protein
MDAVWIPKRQLLLQACKGCCMPNGSNVPISITTTSGGVAIGGTVTGAPSLLLPGHVKAGLLGTSDDGIGVCGQSKTGPAVSGESGPRDLTTGTINVAKSSSDGVFGSGKNGVHGLSRSPTDSGVWGENAGGGHGVAGSTNSSYQPGANGTAGIWGHNTGSGVGVKGTSVSGDAVIGVSTAKDHAGLSAVNDSGGFGVWARGTPAGHFEGDVEVTGDVKLTNSDCAEDFVISDSYEVDPGTVMVINPKGALEPCYQTYDNKVAGVVSGAGSLKPGIILGRQEALDKRMPLALLGKVYCKVDASRASIEMGDLLTTSDTPGHAMKAADPQKAFGAVIGKALSSWEAGQGLIPILVALQ